VSTLCVNAVVFGIVNIITLSVRYLLYLGLFAVVVVFLLQTSGYVQYIQQYSTVTVKYVDTSYVCNASTFLV